MVFEAPPGLQGILLDFWQRPIAHLKTLQDYPPRQGADTLSMKKATDEAMKKMENPHGSSN